jgi:hypothetical protein
MTGTKIFLILSVLVWLPYALFCVFVPSYVAEVAGVVGSTPTGTTEIRAMYGGLQAGIGAMCVFALVRPGFAPSALTALCFLASGLFLARLIGFAIDGSGSDYTHGALVFESIYALAAGFLSRRSVAVGD